MSRITKTHFALGAILGIGAIGWSARTFLPDLVKTRNNSIETSVSVEMAGSRLSAFSVKNSSVPYTEWGLGVSGPKGRRLFLSRECDYSPMRPRSVPCVTHIPFIK
ncbi:MAG: hypothetical protein WDO70_02490 [Alphaproteobacteria bacterium]